MGSDESLPIRIADVTPERPSVPPEAVTVCAVGAPTARLTLPAVQIADGPRIFDIPLLMALAKFIQNPPVVEMFGYISNRDRFGRDSNAVHVLAAEPA